MNCCVFCGAPITSVICNYCGTSHAMIAKLNGESYTTEETLYADGRPIITLRQEALASGAISINEMRRLCGLGPIDSVQVGAFVSKDNASAYLKKGE